MSMAISMVNGHFRILCKAYIRGYPHKIWANIWYSQYLHWIRSWRSPICNTQMIHVWWYYICLHLGHLWGKCWDSYSIHGWSRIAILTLPGLVYYGGLNQVLPAGPGPARRIRAERLANVLNDATIAITTKLFHEFYTYMKIIPVSQVVRDPL